MSKGREAVKSERSVTNNLSPTLAGQCLPRIFDHGPSQEISGLRNVLQEMLRCSGGAGGEDMRVKAFALVPRGGDPRIQAPRGALGSMVPR